MIDAALGMLGTFYVFPIKDLLTTGKYFYLWIAIVILLLGVSQLGLSEINKQIGSCSTIFLLKMSYSQGKN